MNRICTLKASINKCPYFDNEECKAENTQCAFFLQEKETERDAYVREERWYEKYYK